MALLTGDIESILKNQTIKNIDIDRFPGKLLKLDSDEIILPKEENATNMHLYSWSRKKQNTPMFIITYQSNIIIIEWHHIATQVFNYLLEKYSL